MDIKIRPAIKEDLPTLLAFEQGIVQYEIPMNPGIRDDEKISYYDLASYIDRSDTLVLVGDHDGKPIASGYGQIRKNKDYLRPETFGYIGFIFVADTYRGKGVSRKIISALEDWFRAQNISHLQLSVYTKNDSAIKSYERQGFEGVLLEMHKNI